MNHRAMAAAVVAFVCMVVLFAILDRRAQRQEAAAAEAREVEAQRLRELMVQSIREGPRASRDGDGLHPTPKGDGHGR